MPERPKKQKPEPLGGALARFLEQSGLAKRVEQAGVIPEWPELVGEQVAAVTDPSMVTADGTLFVAVRTNAWMTELSLMEPELLRAINAKPDRPPVHKIRWTLMR
jgi:predicted nucleic acid-binding Zn ribbon protein